MHHLDFPQIGFGLGVVHIAILVVLEVGMIKPEDVMAQSDNVRQLNGRCMVLKFVVYGLAN
jgi:hypothetical protein